MATKQYLDYAGLKEVLTKLKAKFVVKAIVFKGSVETVADLPALTAVDTGWMYTINKESQTTSDFVEGAGKTIDPYSEVAVVNTGTESAPVYKWYVMGNVFSIKDKVSFGSAFPAEPFDQQVFCYMGDTTYTYTEVSSPATTDNPSANEWYEKSGDNYVLSTDTAVDSSKTYYERAVEYGKGNLYYYDLATTKWLAPASEESVKMTPITDAAIDALFEELWPTA